MNYVITEDMLECFKYSLKLSKQYAEEKIFSIQKCGSGRDIDEKAILEHKNAIKNINIVLEELNNLKAI